MASDMPRRSSFLEAVRTVLAALFGVRRRSDHERDAKHVSPLQIVFIAAVMVAVFVLVLITVVRTVVGP